MQRFRELGANASQVAEALRELSAQSSSHSNGAAPHEALAPLDIDARFQQLLDEAQALLASAHAEDFPDVASETDALQQRMQALRPRLGEILRAQAAAKS